MAAHSPKTSLYHIGSSKSGEFGVGNKKAQKELTKCNWSENIQIKHIYASWRYTIIKDIDGKYYSAGDNADGACTLNDKSSQILNMTPITYFKENNIKIARVFVNNNGDAPFWETEDGSIYTSYKSNLRGRAGVELDKNKAINKIPFLSQLSIKKMISGYCCSIAICNDGSVYSTGTGNRNGDNGLGAKGKDNTSWKRIECLKDIIDCDFGNEFAIFLSSSGRVFSCGRNDLGQLGINTKDAANDPIMRDPTEIAYFKENNIAIQSIGCGWEGAVALDNNGNVYHWGKKLTTYDYLACPEKIEMDEKIVNIKTGCLHFICQTEQGHFISIGRGGDGECCRDDGYAYSPQIIDEWILKRINSQERKILAVIPGNDSTFVLASNTNGLEDEKEQAIAHSRVQSAKKPPQEEQKERTQNPSQVEAFLAKLGLKEYMGTFTENKLETMEDLHELTKEDWKELGVALKDRKTIQKAITACFDDDTGKDIAVVSVSPIEEFLSGLGLARHLDAFREEEFETMDDFKEITEDQLKEIGLKMAHRMKLLRGIRAFFTEKAFGASTATSTTHNEERKQNDEDVGKARKNALIACVGISEYDELDNLDTASDIALYRALFEDKYHYKVIANDTSKRMTKKDVKQFLRNVRKEHLYDFDDERLYYDALIVTFGGHGTYDSIICSDGTKYKHKDLRKIFLIDELTEIPKIFLIDACRMDDDHDVQAQKVRKAHTASTFSTTLMTSEGNPVYGAQICRFITERLSESCANNEFTDFRTVYLAAKKRIREATTDDQDLQLCEHDTDIESVVFKPKHAYAQRGTKAKRYYADTKQTTTVDFVRTFLKNIRLDHYYDAFKAKGLLDEASLKGVNKGTLTSLGIKHQSNREKIMKAIKNLK